MSVEALAVRSTSPSVSTSALSAIFTRAWNALVSSVEKAPAPDSAPAVHRLTVSWCTISL